MIGAAYIRDYPSLGDGIQEGGETSISLSTAAGVTFVEPRTAYGFSYPGTAQPAVKIGEFGPNLEVTSTPEPSMTALIGLGSICLLFWFSRVHRRLVSFCDPADCVSAQPTGGFSGRKPPK